MRFFFLERETTELHILQKKKLFAATLVYSNIKPQIPPQFFYGIAITSDPREKEKWLPKSMRKQELVMYEKPFDVTSLRRLC